MNYYCPIEIICAFRLFTEKPAPLIISCGNLVRLLAQERAITHHFGFTVGTIRVVPRDVKFLLICNTQLIQIKVSMISLL